MSALDFGDLVTRHRKYVRSGATRPAAWRENQLIALRTMMEDRAEEFYAALWSDLRRNRVDADWTDVKYSAGDADHARAHLHALIAPERVRSRLACARSP